MVIDTGLGGRHEPLLLSTRAPIGPLAGCHRLTNTITFRELFGFSASFSGSVTRACGGIQKISQFASPLAQSWLRVGILERQFGKSKNLLGDSRVAHRAAEHPVLPPGSEFKRSDTGDTSMVFMWCSHFRNAGTMYKHYNTLCWYLPVLPGPLVATCSWKPFL